MFVAGIEIFFGLVAGAILLSLGIAALSIAWLGIAAVFEAVSREIQRGVEFVQTHPGKVALAAIYLLVALALTGDTSRTLSAIGLWMLLFAPIGVLITYFRFRKRSTTPSATKI